MAPAIAVNNINIKPKIKFFCLLLSVLEISINGIQIPSKIHNSSCHVNDSLKYMRLVSVTNTGQKVL